MNQKQSWEEEFDKKAELSFARGGFLITDYPGENGVNHWCLDPLSIKDFIKQAIQTREREISEELKKMRAESGDYCEEECEHGECYLAGAEEKVIDKVLSIINKKCACKKISEKYPGGIYFTEVKTANGGIPGIVHVKCPVHD